MKITQHSPTPWGVHSRTMDIQGDSMRPIFGSDCIILAFVSDKNLKDTRYRDVDAAFIVQAVNAHEALVKIAKAYRNLLKTAAHTDGEVATYHHIEKVLKLAEEKSC